MNSHLVVLLASTLAALVHAAPAQGSICHVLTYSGQCGNLTSIANSSSSATPTSSPSSSSSDSCSFASICLVPTTCNATALTGSINALTGEALSSQVGNETLPTNSTGCVAFQDFGMQMDSLAVCDGNRYLINGTSTAYQCICNDSPDSCPEEGTAISISYANGTSSTSAGAASQGPSAFSWTWGATGPTSTGSSAPSKGISSASTPSATARTTFTFTFGGNNASSTSNAGATAGIGNAGQSEQNNGPTGDAVRVSGKSTTAATTSLVLTVLAASSIGLVLAILSLSVLTV